VRVFDARNGTIKKTLVGHEAAVNCMAIVDDKLFTGSTDATLRIWDIKDLR
jgi:WD40 repeat protein